MEFHLDTYQVIRLTNKLKPITGTYSIHEKNLEFLDLVKYLGIFIDSKLNWKEQYFNTYKEANLILSFLRRIFYKCPTNVQQIVLMR